MKEILLGVLILIGFIIVIYVLAVYPATFLNEFEKSCHEAINKMIKNLKKPKNLIKN